MKRTLLFFSVLCLFFTAAQAQQADFQKVAAKYKNVNTVTADVKKTTHRTAMAKDVVTYGKLTMKRPNEVSIIMDGGKDQLIMKGSTFTMVANGKKHTTTSQANAQFVSFQAVFESFLAGGQKSISQLSDLKMTKSGTMLILTITPNATTKKEARRMMFTSFVLSIDTKTDEIKSIRMNEKAGNYTEYSFSRFVLK